VLAKSMDQTVDEGLDQDARGVFVASLWDDKTQTKAKSCVVTGYPVLDNAVEMDDGAVANRPDWNKFVMCAKSSHDEKLQVGWPGRSMWANNVGDGGQYREHLATCLSSTSMNAGCEFGYVCWPV